MFRVLEALERFEAILSSLRLAGKFLVVQINFKFLKVDKQFIVYDILSMGAQVFYMFVAWVKVITLHEVADIPQTSFITTDALFEELDCSMNLLGLRLDEESASLEADLGCSIHSADGSEML